MPLTPQQIKDYYKTQGSSATPLSPAQYEASITSANLAPPPSINLPPKPIPTPVTTVGGQAVIDTNAKTLTATTPSGATVDTTTGALVTPPPTTPAPADTTSGLDSLFAKYFGAQQAPPSSADLYTKTYGITPEQARIKQETAQADANLKAQAVKTAQSKLSSVNARLAGISAEAQAIPIQAQQDATGRGITTGGLAPITTAKLRENALKAIPLQAEALGAQAEVASAKGDQQLADDILKQASDQLDTFFQAQLTDAKNVYDFRDKQLNAIYDFATKKEQARIDSEKVQNAQDLQLYRDNIKRKDDLSKTAIENGQGTLAGKIGALDPKSATFESDLAKLSGQIQAKATAPKIIGSAASGYFKVDAQGTVTPLNTPGENNPTSTTTAIPPQSSTALKNALNSSKFSGAESDGKYADPNLYLANYQSWIQQGGDPAVFLREFPPATYINPANTFLPPEIMKFTKKTASSGGGGVDFNSL